MTDKPVILEFNKPYFELKLEPDQLIVRANESSIKDMRKLVEASPHLMDSFRWMFATIFPLHVKLADIERVECNQDKTQVNLKIPSKHDVHLPLDPPECTALVEKLSGLIVEAKQRSMDEKIPKEELLKGEEADVKVEREESTATYERRVV